MNEEKQFDCVKFKNELQEKLLKDSGAKNLREYVNYANKISQNSSLHKRKGDMKRERANIDKFIGMFSDGKLSSEKFIPNKQYEKELEK
jgi:hypothetical protein